MKQLTAVALFAVTFLGIFATQAVAVSSGPEVSTTLATSAKPSKSAEFDTILYYYASGPLGTYKCDRFSIFYLFQSCASQVYVETANIPEIHDSQTWSTFWSQVSSSPLPKVNFEAQTVLLVSVPVSPFGTPTFNVTRAFRSDTPLPICVSPPNIFPATCAPPPPTLHIQLEGVVTVPGQNCVFPAIVLPPRYLVAVVEIHKTELPAALTAGSVVVPC